MIIVKRQAPEFYDCKCDKCQAEFLLQLDDLTDEDVENPDNDNPVLAMLIPRVRRYVDCPCCGNKIYPYYANPSIGLGLNGGFGSR